MCDGAHACHSSLHAHALYTRRRTRGIARPHTRRDRDRDCDRGRGIDRDRGRDRDRDRDRDGDTDGGRGREVQEAQDLGIDAAQDPHLTSKQNTHKNEGLMDANE
jgi:ribosome assembly protein YihI (activator of Der GTPase)